MQLMFLDKINKDSYKPEVVSFFRVTVRIALLRVSLAIAFRWASQIGLASKGAI